MKKKFVMGNCYNFFFIRASIHLFVANNILLRETLGTTTANGSFRQKQVCDAARCLGLHARYTDVFNKYYKLPNSRGFGQSWNAHRDGDCAL